MWSAEISYEKSEVNNFHLHQNRISIKPNIFFLFSQTASFLGPMAQLCHRYSNLAHTVWVDLFPQLWNLLTEKQQQVSYEILPTLVKRNKVFLTRGGSTRQRIENNKIQCLTLREFDVKFHAKKPIQVFSREIEHRIYKYSWKRNFSYFVRVWYQYTCTS